MNKTSNHTLAPQQRGFYEGNFLYRSGPGSIKKSMCRIPTSMDGSYLK